MRTNAHSASAGIFFSSGLWNSFQHQTTIKVHTFPANTPTAISMLFMAAYPKA